MSDAMFDLQGKRVFVAGHRGMVGSALVRRLASEGCTLVSAGRAEMDLRRQDQVEAWFAANKPDVVFLAAARVGGIWANSHFPGEFIYENMMIEANVIEAARRNETRKLLFLGSACIYPRDAPQPIPESALLSGPLEPTNEWYAVAKIAGIKLAQGYRAQYGCDFISAQPTNLYGTGDNFDLQQSHVIPALIRKAHTAKLASDATMPIWGSGTPQREFLHVDDLADALVFLVKHYSDPEIVNVGSGEEVTIRQLAETVNRVVGFDGDLVFDASKPDGVMRKLVDVSKINALGWRHRYGLEEGLAGTYRWFLDHHDDARGLGS
ncbi:GDP-L-fucose synthase [Sphingomonas sp. AR_OL41]|uniref:GDP-L-fucose synthase n=1 Tax=Sphingomonas sp. AR_OL41 TaxID=3042729 RepID=UPI0024803494|nr:GDP-L-fucose synthase [Sphingomonas sp. AR_OL41]MDH7973392.1 GDP-L-fucose synthase [Sphingomonas sp. AR_OL41]